MEEVPQQQQQQQIMHHQRMEKPIRAICHCCFEFGTASCTWLHSFGISRSSNESRPGCSCEICHRTKKKKLVITKGTFHTDGKSNGSALKPKIYTDSSNFVNKKGIITWHLFASHASIEHRINKLPHVAAKVYELGLRTNQWTFLATPQYVLQYCSLLFEIGDEENLWNLLTRAIAACEKEYGDQTADDIG